MFIVHYECSEICPFFAKLAKYRPVWHSWVPKELRKVPPPAHKADEIVKKRVDEKFCAKCGSIVEVESGTSSEDLKSVQCPMCGAYESFIKEGDLCPMCNEGKIEKNDNLTIRF
jgi:DNA-directed RNA polymerase subunit RPC12/RpoP